MAAPPAEASVGGSHKMARGGLAELVIARPLVSALAAADPGIGEDGDHLPAMALGDCRKFAAQVLDCLRSRPGG
jgi:hypothetical protein